jgi:hypothetical protein
LVIVRMTPPIYLTSHDSQGYERAIPDEMKHDLSVDVYNEILIQHTFLSLIKTKFVDNVSQRADIWTLQTSCTAKGSKWADALPGVVELWEDWNSKARSDVLTLLKAIRQIGTNRYNHHPALQIW